MRQQQAQELLEFEALEKNEEAWAKVFEQEKQAQLQWQLREKLFEEKQEREAEQKVMYGLKIW